MKKQKEFRIDVLLGYEDSEVRKFESYIVWAGTALAARKKLERDLQKQPWPFKVLQVEQVTI
jgi:hypothetical protein